MLVVFAFVACTQDVMNEQNAINIAAPDTITVGFEGSDTRIQLNEAMKTVWNKGDQVSVFYKSFDNLKYEFQGNTGDRDGVLKKVDGTWGGQTMHQTTIVYPYNTNYLVSTNGNIEAILPSIQHYAEGSYGIGDNLMVAQSEFNNFSLRNTCGWLRLHLTGDGQKVKSIKFIGNNDEQVAGLVYVNTANAELTLANSVCDVPFDDESGELTPGGVDGNFFIEDVISKGVTLDLGDGVELNDESKAFYIALPPQTFEQGFTIIITRIDGGKMIKSTSKALTIDRNHIQPMETINFEITDLPKISEITLRADKSIVMPGETITFFVEYVDEDGFNYDITDNATIFDKTHDYVEVSNTFTPTVTGYYEFYAEVDDYVSNTVGVLVGPYVCMPPSDPQPNNFTFNYRALVIDHAGVNNGYCPYALDQLKLLESTEWHQYYNEVTCHAGSYASGDPGNSAAANALNQFQSSMIIGYPCILVNFYGMPSNYISQNVAAVLANYVQKDGVDVGISLAVTGDETCVYATAQVKSGVAQEYKITAWLLESNIYSPNQAGATKDYHKIYNNALRNMSHEYSETNVQGDAYTFTANEVKYLAFELPIISTNWKYENMSVLVIVSAKDANGRWEVVNTAKCQVGETKMFEYLE